MSPPLRQFSRSLPMALLRAREAVMGRFRVHLRRHGVTEQQWRVLRALSSTPEVTASALVQATLIKPPSLSRIIRDLAARKLIVRRGSPRDQRTTLLSLSSRGTAFLRAAGPESEACYQEIAAVIGPSRLSQLYRFLDELVRRLDPASR